MNFIDCLTFDLKVCYIHMTLKEFDQETANLIPNMIKMELELELSMYTISERKLVYYDEGTGCQ